MTEPRKCVECQNWDDCYGKNYYLPSEIQWCRWQILWLLWHLEEIQTSIYPSDGSSYSTWPPILGKGAKSGAYFETPAGLAAIVTDRLEKTGKDGVFLLDQIKMLMDDTADTFSQFYEKGDINRDAKAALGYICGHKERVIPYRKWKWTAKKG